LIAVSAASNRSKGDKDPSQWLPKNSAYTCTYVVSWLQVKYRWSLTVDEAEKIKILKVLESCPASKLFTLPKVAISPPAPSPLPTQTPEAVSSTSSPVAGESGLDPKFPSCAKAKEAGYGPYIRGIDPEYEWYRDGDSDGTACE
jgi:hypothetical protein